MTLMALVGWLLLILGVPALLAIVGFVYLAVVLAWEDEHTRGNAYYGMSLEDRRRFRERLRFHARVLWPVIRLGSVFTTVTLPKASFRFQGIAGPKGTCSEESFARGHAYEPGPADIFVVTQMKCGTTWMQHLVYQVLTRGAGDLAQEGKALYAVAPWLEGLRSVGISEAPLIGPERPSRIIKTHFPSELCPFGAETKYVYVVRHPVSCFASCVDFIRANLGAFSPGIEEIRDWYCSDEHMWWGSWSAHVDGWWRLAREHDNVLFVRFETMKQDLPGVARDVANFLGISELSPDELDAIVTKCGFEYMRDYGASFEMQPPHLLALDADLLVKGTADRYRDVQENVRADVMAWCSRRLDGADFPIALEYPAT